MKGRGLVAAALILSSVTCGVATRTNVTPSASAGTSGSPAHVATPPPTPRTTPPGTPGPIPSEPTVRSASIEVPPPAFATPTVEPGLWRLEGYVVDESGAPVPSACVVVGPNGCRTYSPHTDDSGHYLLDVAQGQATFDLYFEMPGYKTVWWRITPTGSTEFNVIMVKG